MAATVNWRQFGVCALLCGCLLGAIDAQALGTQVLSNFNQPSSGTAIRLGVGDVRATPFTTDASFTEFDGVELSAVTLFAPGLFFVEIWDVDAFAQPNSVVAVLSGPSAPSGFARYTGTVSLQPNTSYFLVTGLRNGGSQVIVDTIDANGTDAAPAPVYQFGTDIDNDGVADLVNACRGTRGSDYVTISWACGQPIARRYFSKLRFLAEEPVLPPSFSLTASPLFVNFGLVPLGGTSAPALVTIENDGTAIQTLGSLTVGARFSLSNDNCSAATLGLGASCTVEVAFTPDHGGWTTGTLIIPAPGDPRSPYGLPLAGESDQPVTVLPPFTTPYAVPLSHWMAFPLWLLLLLAYRSRLQRLS